MKSYDNFHIIKMLAKLEPVNYFMSKLVEINKLDIFEILMNIGILTRNFVHKTN